jgi:hypothetical protein
MSGHLDVINMANREWFKNDYINFTQNDPILEKLVTQGNVKRKSGGYEFEQALFPRAGTQGVEIDDTGLTTVPRSSYNVTELVKVSPVALASDIVLTQVEMDKIGTQNAEVYDLVKKRKGVAGRGWVQDIMGHFIGGQTQARVFAAGQLKNMLTLDGDHSTGTKTGNIHGLLDYDTPANQTSAGQLVMNLAKNTANEHYNQYQVATDWSTDGFASMIETQRLTRVHDITGGNGADLVAMSSAAFVNLQASIVSNLQIVNTKDNGRDMEAMTYVTQLGPGVRAFSSPYIDPSQYTTSSAQGGVALHLNTRSIFFFSLLKGGSDKAAMIKGLQDDFVEDPGQQRIYVCKLFLHGNWFVENLKGHGVTANIDA